MGEHACTNAEGQRKWAEQKSFHVTHKEFLQFLTLACCLVSQNINTVSRLSTPQLTLPVYLFPSCLSKSHSNPFPSLMMWALQQKECIQVRASGVWGYSAEISHWRKVNMVGVMRLETNWERRRGHMGLIMAQLPDSEAVFIDLAWARILQTLETPSMLVKPSLEIAPW